ncbi:prothoracicostatic peptide isoform X2 [Hetaerina americana]|uniref:prothoracicostatic peptide isoform X2 n=1 Tax=Hetaerina americana TaxID=62018 RepID=UPI003A7F3AFF
MLPRLPLPAAPAARLLLTAIPLILVAVLSGTAFASDSQSSSGSSAGEQMPPSAAAGMMQPAQGDGPTGGVSAESVVDQHNQGSGTLSAEKRGWADMQHGWGKRGWADLRSAWGKRGWRDLQAGWGKRDWNSIRGAWGKRGTGSWNNFRGSWGKRGSGSNEWGSDDPEGYPPNVYDDGEEGEQGGWEAGSDADDGPYGRQRELELEAAAAAAEGLLPPPPPPEYYEDKRSWANLKGAWGKRASAAAADETAGDDGDDNYGKRAWKNLKGSWGKRDPGWHNLKGLWGKRAPAAKWNKLTSVWGKRSIGGETGVKSLSSGV